MAGILVKMGDIDNVKTYEFRCDEVDVSMLPTLTQAGRGEYAQYEYAPFGSIAITENGIYMLFTNGWTLI